MFIIGTDPADIAVQRQPERFRRRLCDRQAHAQDRVGAELALVVGAIKRDQLGVDVGLVLRLEADDGLGDWAVDRFHRLADPLAAPAALVAVAQLHCLMRARRRTGRDRRPAHAAVLQGNVHLHRGIAAAVEDLAGVDVDDGGHGQGTLCGSSLRSRAFIDAPQAGQLSGLSLRVSERASRSRVLGAQRYT
jgi:hypothetical protein